MNSDKPIEYGVVIHPKSSGMYQNLKSPFLVFVDAMKGIDDLLECAKAKLGPICFVGSSCMYPDKESALVEEDLGTGPVYPANALFSYTKLLAWQVCKAISKEFEVPCYVAIPSDIFGDPNDTHFIAQIMKKLHVAKEDGIKIVTLPGTGTAIRHPIYDKDFEKITEWLLSNYRESSPINVATPVSYAKKISSIVNDIKDVVGYTGIIEWDASLPDGQKVKVLSNDKLTNIAQPVFTPWMDSLKEAYRRMTDEI